MEYHDALAALQREGDILAHDAPESDAARAAFAGLFEPFEPEALRASVRRTYAAAPFFNDTLKTIRDRDALGAYLARTAAAVDDCQVRVDEWAPAALGWYVRWCMSIRFKRFRPDVDTRSIGISHIVFDRDGRIALHQDFWDAAGGLYEHVPVLGGILRRIRRRL